MLFYLLGGLAALAVQVLAGPDAVAPTIGASGAIAAVLGPTRCSIPVRAW